MNKEENFIVNSGCFFMNFYGCSHFRSVLVVQRREKDIKKVALEGICSLSHDVFAILLHKSSIFLICTGYKIITIHIYVCGKFIFHTTVSLQNNAMRRLPDSTLLVL